MRTAILAMDLGGTRIKMGLVRDGQLLAKTNLDLPASTLLKPLLPFLEGHVELLCKQAEVTEISAVGMSFPTIVDSDRNRLLYQYVKYTDAGEIDLENWIKERWNARLVMENDARAALVGEWQFGAGTGIDNLVMITIGTGIGSAALINGQLLKGSHYLAGNLGGHMPIDWNGPACNCGNKGCPESLSASWALPQILQGFEGFASSHFNNGAKPDFETLFDLASQGDSFSITVRDHCMNAWSASLLNLVYAYDPQRLILGGGVMHSADTILPYIKKRLDQAAWLPKDAFDLVEAASPDWAGVLGMAWLANPKNKTH